MVGREDIVGIVHSGDLSYDLINENGKRGDDYFKYIQPFASSIPYMYTPGNHEHYSNYSNQAARLHMPLNE